MGVRVYFTKGSRDGALGHFLSAPLDEFQDWFMDQYFDHSLAEVESEQILILDDIIRRGAVALIPDSQEQARLIDNLIYQFYYWCNWEKKELIVEACNGDWKSYRYHDAEPKVRLYFGNEIGRLWSFILNGRPVGRSETQYPYVPVERPFPKAFWTYEEASFVYHKLLPHQNAFSVMFDDEQVVAIEATFEATENAFREGIGLIIEVA